MGEPSRSLETSRTKVSCKDCTRDDLCLPHGLDSTEVEHLYLHVDALDNPAPLRQREHAW